MVVRHVIQMFFPSWWLYKGMFSCLHSSVFCEAGKTLIISDLAARNEETPHPPSHSYYIKMNIYDAL